MEMLCISITFLDDRFHGQAEDGPEWPPSPWRLFQALLAAAAGNRQEKPECFEFLERLPPPEILAPPKIPGQARKTYVPNNASDVKLDRQARLTEKNINPVLIAGKDRTVHYLWSFPREAEAQVPPIVEYARMLTAVGLGIDLVAGNGLILSPEQAANLRAEYAGDCWKVLRSAALSLRCPREGSYQDLKVCYATALKRWNGPVYTPAQKPVVFEEVGYVKEGAASRPMACFKLLKPGNDSERLASFDPRDAVHVSAWARSCLCALCKQPQVNFDGDSEEYVAGHIRRGQERTPPRFSYLPLPSIGHEHADGLIRRLIIAEPYEGNGQKAQWAGRVLQSAMLKTDDGECVAELMRTSRREDSVFKRYTQAARRFKTVTPVILPGFDGLKYAKAEKLFLKALHQAGFSPDDVQHIHLRKAPFQKHAYHPRDYRRARHFERYSAMHVEVTWKYDIHGPLAVGAGRHRGLGLFVSQTVGAIHE